jgi:hypothetical protein
VAVDRDALRNWHRLFGLLLTDFFTGSPFTVEVERDLSLQQQFLDVVILRRGRGRFRERLPDGLDLSVEHNLITFKSLREALDAWAMKELVGHYVAYRKLVSLSPSELLPEESFRLYAVCSRFPHNLASQVPWHPQQAGVYHCHWGTDVVTVIVVGELSREAHNAPLHLFSSSAEAVAFGRRTYRQRSEQTSRLLLELFDQYRGEGIVMPYTMEDFDRDFVRTHFVDLPPEERGAIFASLPPEERRGMVASLPAEERLVLAESLPPKERRELIASLPPEERLAGLSPEQIREYLERLPGGTPTKSRKPRGKR